ncbi:hypothetical protein Z517_10893 [Fonsecaea pedrosoi CBS 271.37]|uniref:Unplaced genomic scaffold supercont1.7, whole genome shotgun sequence n=1 Tax=Fonsecaea pedrosoi CBS 271.37 TaxID=1442368 RepID=A0A0D2G665_9EURO|nr:uncharacterized protein Z517_10893 [Fonsecaea pedrosoi CBS 271.37]KIW76148.1 hypothetical protein Z517_10893 [Fonsecaea pedrosoi CBS 271.37]
MLLRTVIRPSLSFPSALKSISAPLARPALKRPVLVAFGLTASLPFIQSSSIIRLDSSPYSPPPAGTAEFSSTSSNSRGPKVPLTKDGKTINPAAVKQISLGSILGLAAGLVVSAFSTSLTLLIGLGIVVWQLAARRGYNIIPVERLQRYFKNIDLRSTVNDNLAFKISFGLMFALSAFGEF